MKGIITLIGILIILLTGCGEYIPVKHICTLRCADTGLGVKDNLCFDKSGYAIPNECSEWETKSEQEIETYYRTNLDYRFNQTVYYQEAYRLSSCDEFVGVYELSHLRNVKNNWSYTEEWGGFHTSFVHPNNIHNYESIGYTCSNEETDLYPMLKCTDYTGINLYAESEIKQIIKRYNSLNGANQGNWSYRIIEKYCANELDS